MVTLEAEGTLDRGRILDELAAFLRCDHLRAHDGVDDGADLFDAVVDASAAIHEEVGVHVVVSGGGVATGGHVERSWRIEIVLVGGLRSEVDLAVQGVARVRDAVAAMLVRCRARCRSRGWLPAVWVLHDA